MTKELIWGVLVLALILTAYISHVEDRRHKETMAKLEARKLEIQPRMSELDKQIELKEELIEENRILHAERRAMESRAESPAESREALRRVHATTTRVERGNR